MMYLSMVITDLLHFDGMVEYHSVRTRFAKAVGAGLV